MGFPKPVSGLVIRYAYLWNSEFLQGREEGTKDRPCAVILVTTDAQGDEVVTVLPITHAMPAESMLAMEIPARTKARIGLDSDRSWIVLSEVNRFKWPGPDLRMAVNGETASVAYGQIPRKFFLQLRERFIAVLKEGRTRVVSREP